MHARNRATINTMMKEKEKMMTKALTSQKRRQKNKNTVYYG